MAGEELRLSAAPAGKLADKFRRAYDWIARDAIVSPYHDMEFGEPVALGRGDAAAPKLPLHQASYSSYILLALLNLATSQRLRSSRRWLRCFRARCSPSAPLVASA